MRSALQPASRVLIVRLDHLGDLLLTTPLIRALAGAGHRVTAVVRSSLRPVLRRNPNCAEVHAVEDLCGTVESGWLTFGRWMREQSFDLVILPYSRPRELLLASLLSRAPVRVAMWGGLLGRLTGHRCLRSGIREGRRHMSDIILDCARVLRVPTAGLSPDFFIDGETSSLVESELRSLFPGARLVGIHPGMSGNACNLDPEVYGELASRLLAREGLAVIGTGVAAEKALFETWPREVLDSPRFLNACGRWNLDELAAAIRCMDVYVIGSTGPLHIAGALGKTTVSPYCSWPPISATVWGNSGGRGHVLAPPPEYCAERRRTRDGHCRFEGAVSAEMLHDAVLRGLNAR
jgi:ADP-heptose:LPS heptosyltransferase